jgi:DNA-binding MarR family transcriptional regulator
MSAANKHSTAEQVVVASPGSDNLGHLLWETLARWTGFAEPELADTQLTPASTGTLGRIERLPGITASELARQSFKTQQAISQVTGRLERLGYIERSVGRGRGVGLYITESGKRALAEGLATEDRIEQQARLLLGEELYAELKHRLRQARDAIATADAD